MTRRSQVRWEARAFRLWIRLLGTRLTARFEDELVVLFNDRLNEAGASSGRRILLLIRSALDAVRHSAAEGMLGPRPNSTTASAINEGRGGGMGSVLQDVRFALRSLSKRPLFTTIAVATLGLGIGGTTSMFSVVDGVLIRDLPYQDPASLVSIWKAWPSWQGQEGLDYVWDHIQFPWDDYLNVRNGIASLSAVAAYQNDDRVLFGRGAPTELSAGLASANLFDVLGVRPVLGRSFLIDEVPPEAEPARVVMLSHQLWQSRFAGDPDVLGQTIRLEEQSFEVVGVLPDRFRLASDLITTHDNGGNVDAGLRDIWLPLGSDGVDCGNCFELLGRLAPGRTAEQARAEVQLLMTYQTNMEDEIARVVSRKEVVTRGFGTPLLVLLGAAGLLLLIACTNVAGLLLGEAAGRRQEIAVRSALGAGRGRIMRQLLTENLLLGVLGAAVGVLVAWGGTEALLTVAPAMPRLEEVELSGRVLLFAATAGVLTGVVFGLAPALALAGHRTGASLRVREGASGASSLQATIVSLQVGLTVVLLVAGGLFGQSLIRVMAVDPGFDAEQLATMGVTIPPGQPVEDEDVLVFYERLFDALHEVPGVESVSAVSVLPFPGGTSSHSFMYERGGEDQHSTQWARWVRPSYHRTLAIPILRGRLLNEGDVADAPGAMLVSESLADQNWPGESPLGMRISYFGQEFSVVGVVGDIRQKALGSAVEPTFYVSTGQMSRRSMQLVIRTSGDPGALLPALHEAIWALDPDVPITAPAAMTDLMRSSEADDRFRALLMWTFATLATLLAAVGIFSVTARAVAARSREIGIRTALGARADGLIRLVLRDGLVSALAGTAAGLVGSYWASSLIGHLLYGIDSRDPRTFVAVAVLSIAVCLFAAYVPARRVTAISPMQVITDD